MRQFATPRPAAVCHPLGAPNMHRLPVLAYVMVFSTYVLAALTLLSAATSLFEPNGACPLSTLNKLSAHFLSGFAHLRTCYITRLSHDRAGSCACAGGRAPACTRAVSTLRSKCARGGNCSGKRCSVLLLNERVQCRQILTPPHIKPYKITRTYM